MSIPPEILEKIKDRYDDLFNMLGPNQELTGHWKGLFWEHYGFETIYTLFKNVGIPFKVDPNDIRPFVMTINGKEVEIDFRMKVENIPVYFGVTAFYVSDRDHLFDVTIVDEPVTDLKQEIYLGNRLIKTIHHGEGRIVGRRKQVDYLNRKLVVRIAKEGLNKFASDYIYIVFPNRDPRLGGDVDGIPAGFKFESHYTYPETGITGIVLVGKFVEVDSKGSKSISKTKWIVKTKSFPKCSPKIKTVLERLDGITLDHKNRLRSIRAFLEQHSENPLFQEYLNSLLSEYGDDI